jgi:poly-beta-1,6-N-acetyl-D-glucosamine synthase
MVWLTLFLIPVSIYGFFILWFFYGWLKLSPFLPKSKASNIFVSIVIAARNEADNLPFLLNDLHNQSYPENFFEIIIVDDHSTDNSYNILQAELNHLKNLKVVSLENDLFGKKQALKKGIDIAKGDFILTTDADCRLGEKWVETFVSYNSAYKSDLIIGPLTYANESSLFEKMQSLEILSLTASGAGAASVGFPILCNGANLFFTKELFVNSISELKNELPSGDDMFLLQAAKKNRKYKIRFLKSFDALVQTVPTHTFFEFIDQRKRWTSKSKHYNDVSIKLIAVIVFLICFLLCCLFTLSFIFPKLFFVYFALLVAKSIIDFPLLYSFAVFFKKQYLLRYFIITQLIYPFYIVFIAIYGNIRNFKWKNRIYQ